MAVFWVLLPPSSGRLVLMMEAAGTSETLVNFYQTTRRYSPEDSHNLPPHRLQKHAALYFRVNHVTFSVVIICTTCFISNSAFCPQSIFMGSVQLILRVNSDYFLNNSINQLIFVMETRCVFFEVRTEFLGIV
jgi:hypothetical protein